MLRTVSDQELKKVVELFEKYIDEETITFVNCGGLSKLNNNDLSPQKIEQDKKHAKQWFNCFSRVKDFTLENPDLDINRLSDYLDPGVKKVFNQKICWDLACWLHGQQAVLTKRQMQPYQFVLLSLTGFEFKKETEMQQQSYGNMIEHINDSEILSEYMTFKNDRIEWGVPKKRQAHPFTNNGEKKMSLFKKFNNKNNRN